MMNVRELIQELEGLVEEDERLAEAPILFAHQPRYPLRCGVMGPVVTDDAAEEIAELRQMLRSDHNLTKEEADEAREYIAKLESSRTPIVYLLEGHMRPRIGGEEISPYASRNLWDLV